MTNHRSDDVADDPTADAGPDLMALAAELASELTDLTSSGDRGVVSYRRGGAVFARASADALEVRLPADIAEAALATPDTAALPGGGGWVRFAPHGRGRQVTDRAAAWFHTAWRHGQAAADRPPATTRRRPSRADH